MNQFDQNINKDMTDSGLIDVESLDLEDDQTWLYTVPGDSGKTIDMVDWNLSVDWPVYDDDDYQKTEKDLNDMLDEIIKNQALAMPDKHKFDSRTYVRPKRRVQRPSIQNIVEVSSNPPSLSPNASLNSSSNQPTNQSTNQSANKYMTYNKYNSPLGPILRLKTFNVDTNTDNSSTIKEYAMKRRSLVQEDDSQLEDVDMTLISEGSERLSSENVPSKPINIDLSQPISHNLHNTFNKSDGLVRQNSRGLTNMINERGSLNMYQSGESLMRMSPPSLVSSLLMESSGTFNPESLDSRKSMPSNRDSGIPPSGRDSIDPMMTSMTLSILDEKDMSTSFLSQTTYPDNDSFMDSLPPSLVSSVNSSYVVSNTSKPDRRTDSLESNSNIFSSATFTHLEQSEKLLSARPRCQMYNSFTKREGLRNSESYTKSREEASQIDNIGKVLNENTGKNDSSRSKVNEMAETITLHYANNKFRKENDAEKENLSASFEKDDTFYKEMGLQKAAELERNSLNITLDKQELNEIIQARQKLSLARRALPTEVDRTNQVDTSPVKTIQLPNQTITVPKRSMENASELLSRRRAYANGFEKTEETREPPRRNATFKKPSPPKLNAMDTTVVYVNDVKDEKQIIDINSATLNLIDSSERTLQQEEWGSQERAMVGSSESTDTGTFSSSSPPDSVPDAAVPHNDPRSIASTPLAPLRKGAKSDLLNLHSTISPIYDMSAIDDKSYTLTKALSHNSSGTYELHNTTVINSATMVKKSAPKRDILAGKVSPEKKILGPSLQQRSPPSRIPPTALGSYSSMAPPAPVSRKTGLPTSKLRQYSSHKELRIPVGGAPVGPTASVSRMIPCGRGGSMMRRPVYASNPALSPTAPAPAPAPLAPQRRDSYTIAPRAQSEREEKPAANPTVYAPPPLVRQGTETLRRERPQSQLVQPKDPPTATRPYSIAGAAQLRVCRPASVPAQRPAPAAEARPASTEARLSALPRPSRLPAPAPRRALRPPSVYSVAPTADIDQY